MTNGWKKLMLIQNFWKTTSIVFTTPFKNQGHTKVINVAPPPPLHICKLGPFNHLIKNLSKLCPDHVEKFTETIHVSKEKYHNEDYEGNEINKCLKNLMFAEIFDKKYHWFIDGFGAIRYL